jgi:hypothetical protein
MKIVYFPNGMTMQWYIVVVTLLYLGHNASRGSNFIFSVFRKKKKIAQIATYVIFEDIPLNDVSFPIYKCMLSCFAYSSTGNMEAICSSETLVELRRTTRRCISEDRTIYLCSWLKVLSQKVNTNTIMFTPSFIKIGQFMFTILIQDGKRCHAAW